MHNYGQYRINKLPKTRNYIGSIDGLPSQRYNGMRQVRNVSDLSIYSTDTPIVNRQSGRERGTTGHGEPPGASMDSEGQARWCTRTHERAWVEADQPLHRTRTYFSNNSNFLGSLQWLPSQPPPLRSKQQHLPGSL